ncbi:hypothetical protein EHP00_752 [Ecytonucleospora hepatopenaei]|uniref:Uncharacterized protein n=1 Tax=Ecytonucleospora hepatopenaei TaxID=646526 RepID=A0A1W0E3E7_9MICR|nr:hypothetical protein EHP00_752 [Ecytonucleospora hepatopenaei]
MKIKTDFDVVCVDLGTLNIGVPKPKFKYFMYSDNRYLSKKKLPEIKELPNKDVEDIVESNLNRAWCNNHFIVWSHARHRIFKIVERYNGFFIRRKVTTDYYNYLSNVFFDGEIFYIVTNRFVLSVTKKEDDINYIYHFEKEIFEKVKSKITVEVKKCTVKKKRELVDSWYAYQRMYLLYGDILIVLNCKTQKIEQALVFSEFLSKIFVFNSNLFVKRAFGWTICKLDLFTYEYLNLIDINIRKVIEVLVHEDKVVIVGYNLIAFLDTVDNIDVFKVERDIRYSNVSYGGFFTIYNKRMCEVLQYDGELMYINYEEKEKYENLISVLGHEKELIEIFDDKIIIKNYCNATYSVEDKCHKKSTESCIKCEKNTFFYKINVNEDIFKKEIKQKECLAYEDKFFEDNLFNEKVNSFEIIKGKTFLKNKSYSEAKECEFEKNKETVTIWLGIYELPRVREFFVENKIVVQDKGSLQLDAEFTNQEKEIRSFAHDLNLYKKYYEEKNNCCEIELKYPQYEWILKNYENNHKK